MSEGVGGTTDRARPERDRVPTGHPTVDEVVESLEQLEGAPVSLHVEVFEAAHEKLRSALADATDDTRGS